MAVPYPGTAARVYSQNTDHRVALAARYIEQNLDRRVTWEDALTWLAAQETVSRDRARDWLLMAVLDLEWTGTIQYDRDDVFRRPGLPADAKPAPLQEVAQAVLALGWPRPSDGKKHSRTIYPCFLELYIRTVSVRRPGGGAGRGRDGAGPEALQAPDCGTCSGGRGIRTHDEASTP